MSPQKVKVDLLALLSKFIYCFGVIQKVFCCVIYYKYTFKLTLLSHLKSRSLKMLTKISKMFKKSIPREKILSKI